mmetsp:Transcript_34799/g.111780  ORF Transcript_34799/g.111780 Transcript_34799/m.111780 type:complete len:99 (-) Transcript_34799:226-522(-)
MTMTRRLDICDCVRMCADCQAYYGAWARLAQLPGARPRNYRFFRYEDLVTRACTAPFASPALVRTYFRREHRCVTINDSLAWGFWNYSNAGCVEVNEL